jgi:hypothetical protein
LQRVFVNQEGMTRRHRIFLAGIILSILVLVSYSGVKGHDFINYDDPAYVTENRHVAKGLDGEGLFWAFTTAAASNWHPLTWVSLMLDRELYGNHPGEDSLQLPGCRVVCRSSAACGVGCLGCRA